MIVSSPNTQTQTKVYVDGFLVNTIETPQPGDSILELALTQEVKELLGDRRVVTIVANPKVAPRFIYISTEIDSG